MIILILLAFFLNFGGTYAVERQDGGVSIVYYFEDSKDTLEDVLRSQNLMGRPIKAAAPEDLPLRSERKYWKLNDVPIGNKVIVETARKQADEQKLLADENRRKALALKMGLSDSEYSEAKGLGILR